MKKKIKNMIITNNPVPGLFDNWFTKTKKESVLNNLNDIKSHIQEQFKLTDICKPTHTINLYDVLNAIFNRIQHLDDNIQDITKDTHTYSYNERIMLINDLKSRKLELQNIIKLLLTKSDSIPIQNFTELKHEMTAKYIDDL